MKIPQICTSLSILSLCFVALLLTSCGGGGGSGTSSSLTYTGETAQATVTAENAVELATGAYMGGDVSSFPVPIGMVQIGEYTGVHDSTLLRAAAIVKEAVSQFDPKGQSKDMATGQVISDSSTVNGQCGGSASFSMTFDDVSGAFSGTFTFLPLDECTEVISGEVSFNGVFEIVEAPDGSPEPGNVISMTMSFNNLDILYLDGVSDQVFWVHNYNIVVTVGTGFVEVQATGTFYNPLYGFITISTPVPPQIFDTDNVPSSGTLEIEGAVGSKARLTFVDASSFTVDVDLEGKGYVLLGTYNWTAL